MEIVEEELVGILQKLLPHIRTEAASHARFALNIPQTCDIKGSFEFMTVHGIEEGFHAPDRELKTIMPLDAIEKWRG